MSHTDALLHATPAQTDQIVRGTCDEPFAVLGPHGAGDRRTVTAFDPGAARLAAVTANATHPLAPVANRPGLFSGRVPTGGPYRLAGANADGETWEIEDPYRFGPILGPLDEHLLGEGRHRRLWNVLGAHVTTHEGVPGTHFAVWAPNARRVSVVGDFNQWDGRRNPMRRRGATGVWEIFLPHLGEPATYKYEIVGASGIPLPLKADPVGFGAEHPPATASVVRDIDGYGWSDGDWMAARATAHRTDAPISIYEVHLGSWTQKDGRPMSYLEAADELIPYVRDMGFTHIELMPISEYPFDGSWGYQPIGLFAPTVRHGPPHEFRDFVAAAHDAGIGVLLDWVPGHFPTDQHGLSRFDGTALYEHQDPREGFHRDWNTLIFNYGRREVANYLVANALYWLEEYHLDGLRVDAVASMLYRDYSRDEGDWIPNVHGGRENLEAIDFLQTMNIAVYEADPGVMTVAEESTAYPKISAPVYDGGLGFGYKWNMGWMNDTLAYITEDPINRRWHHHKMTFGLTYAFTENFVLPISHDEVVHGKGSMLGKMPGLMGDKFANLRAYYGFMWGHPGKKLLFMGQEFAQTTEWSEARSLPWELLDDPAHKGVQRLVAALNHLYRSEPALYVNDCAPGGFEWIEANDAERSVYAWLRRGGEDDRPVVVVANLTPSEGESQRLPARATLTLPPLSVLFLAPERAAQQQAQTSSATPVIQSDPPSPEPAASDTARSAAPTSARPTSGLAKSGPVTPGTTSPTRGSAPITDPPAGTSTD